MLERATNGPAEVIAFGAFRLTPATRTLTRNGIPVRVGGRALDLLIALVERAGTIVGKQELLDLLWPQAVVEESNLRVHVAALRRALGDSRTDSRFIVNMTGRGYSFVADIQRVHGAEAEDQAPAAPAYPDPPPSPLAPLIGRDDTIKRIIAKLPERRFVTITGAGGIGKTAVALAVADQLAGRYRDGILFADLGPLSDPTLIVAHVAALLRLPTSDALPLRSLLAHLNGRNMLIVLDNCEHVVSGAAELAEAVLQASAGVHVLATSREVLRGAGEWVERLGPLSAPPSGVPITAAEAMRYPAVELLVERIRACIGSFELTDELAPMAAELCQRLDGLPLAMELAATRIPTFGLREVLQRLEDPFRLLTKGRRSAAPRHRTLGAMIDWSYESLPDDEKRVWRRLSVFAGAFGAQAAGALMPPGMRGVIDILDVLDRLFEKSLIALNVEGGDVSYRMLDTLRLYAAGRLDEAGELPEARRLHAEYFYTLCRDTDASLIETPREGWSQTHGRHVADIRAALARCFGPDGDVGFGIRLTAASTSFWFRLLLVPELRGHLERALAAAAGRPDMEPAVIVRLNTALGHAVFHSLGPVSEVREALERALKAARDERDITAQLQILWAIFGNDSTKGDYVKMAEAMAAVADLRGIAPDAVVEPLHHRVSALGYHLLGEQERAAQHVELALAHPAVKRGIPREGVFVYDHETATNSHKARILWVQGRYDAALEVVHDTLARASRIDQPFAVGYFLVFGACPVAIWSGDLGFAGQLVAEIFKVTSGTAFNVWQLSAKVYSRVVEYASGKPDIAAGLRGELLQRADLTPFQMQSMATFDQRLLRSECLIEARDGKVSWCTAEVLRGWGEARLTEGTNEVHAEVAATFLKALDLARSQGACAWELRVAISLARLERLRDERLRARDVLAPAFDRAGGAASQADVRTARLLLEELA
ncbi:winged helix-turn-helix domain-containing protein [Aquabacter sp. CN5-332]|uniref:ATP-binding protein n=1 Tax=Aquabacter sp. CN5-332 TaxID=3156608 RepID=UPI0032B48A69